MCALPVGTVAGELYAGARLGVHAGPGPAVRRAVPVELRGRAMTVLSAGLMTVQGIGMTLAGVAAEAVGVRTAVAGAGVLGAACRCALAAAARRPPPAPVAGLVAGATRR
ncbi:hypothetical protein GCM10011578_086870 [Streptomyces fuscichromogenes]|uniref:MFS transporter n=1 Tax=Streptomyces fuscichromogenes TaxID=1324013 RepID=A0A917XNE8_9ACTN|nr:hypothetical protein GCM10011578_086870 [Streptomyces fuscichromogenes]